MHTGNFPLPPTHGGLYHDTQQQQNIKLKQGSFAKHTSKRPSEVYNNVFDSLNAVIDETILDDAITNSKQHDVQHMSTKGYLNIIVHK